MKTLKSIAVTILFFTITANAQITKGNWMVGGYANFGSTTSESTFNGITNKNKSSGLLISPTIGYFVANKFAVGLSGNFGLSIPEQGDNVTSYGFGPFVRYYLLKPEKTINLLTQVGYYYGTTSIDSESNNYNIKVGPVVYFNSSVGLEFTVDYSVSKSYTASSESNVKGINIGFGLQIHLEK